MDIGPELASQGFFNNEESSHGTEVTETGRCPTWQDFLNNTLNLKTKAKLNYHVIICFVLVLYFFFLQKMSQSNFGVFASYYLSS